MYKNINMYKKYKCSLLCKNEYKKIHVTLFCFAGSILYSKIELNTHPSIESSCQ